MSIMLESILIINGVILTGILWTHLVMSRNKLKQQEKEEYSRNLVAIEGLADVFSLED